MSLDCNDCLGFATDLQANAEGTLPCKRKFRHLSQSGFPLMRNEVISLLPIDDSAVCGIGKYFSRVESLQIARITRQRVGRNGGHKGAETVL